MEDGRRENPFREDKASRYCRLTDDYDDITHVRRKKRWKASIARENEQWSYG